MMKNKKILIIGGDLRQARLSERLAEDNKVYTVGLENGKNPSTFDNLRKQSFDYIVLPIPACDEKGKITGEAEIEIQEVVGFCGPFTVLLGGKLPQSVKTMLEKKNIEFIDYAAREDFAVLNAVPTAEGAIQLAMEELPITLSDSKILVVGYGKIGKALSARLKGLNADLTVSARKSRDIAEITGFGIKPLYTESIIEQANGFDLIINTVPAPVLDEKVLTKLKKDCVVIDLASKPGGVDFETARSLSIKVVWALSLPGKTAPISAGDIIFESIKSIERERGHSFE